MLKHVTFLDKLSFLFLTAAVSNAVDYAKKKDVLPTILSTFSLKFMGQ